MLKPYACQDTHRVKRLFDEPPCPLRSSFSRDRERISRSYAFRRLKRTTQVFPSSNHPTFRTRLTHSMEVAQTARILARNLHVNEDLAEAISLAHDVGHPPFGHCGEDALNECTRPWIPFNHNDQTFRWVTCIERSYVNFNGLNLCWDTLEGIVKHSGPISANSLSNLPTIKAFSQQKLDLFLDTHPSLEAQIAGIADDITYNTHDIEDSVEAGYITLDDLLNLPYMQILAEKYMKNICSKNPRRFVFQLLRHSLQELLYDVMNTTVLNLQKVRPISVWDIRNHPCPLVDFSKEMSEHLTSLRSFLFKKVYRAEPILEHRLDGAKKIKALFTFLFDNPACLPENWKPASFKTELQKVQTLSDYIASRTEYDLDIILQKFDIKVDTN